MDSPAGNGSPTASPESDQRERPSRWSHRGGRIAYLVPVVALLVLRYLLPANICDDAFITFRSAIHLATGQGLVFNSGESVFLVTTPLWAMLLTGTRLLVPDVVTAAKLLAMLFELGLLLTVVRLGRVTCGSRWTGLVAAALLCTNPVLLLTSFSGMELPLYLLAISLAFLLLAQDRPGAALTIASLGVWIRFEGLILFGVVLVSVLVQQRSSLRSHWRRWMPALLIPAGVLCAYAILGLACYGELIPAGVLRKAEITPQLFTDAWVQGVKAVSLQFLLAFAGRCSYWFIASTPLAWLAVPFAVGIVRLFYKRAWRILPILAYAILYAGAYTATGNGEAVNYPWYFVPHLIGAYLVAAYGVDWLIVGGTGWLGGRWRAPVRSCIPLLLVGAWFIYLYMPIKQDADHLSGSVYERERVYATAAVWLGRHLEAGSTIAANEIGAIGFFSPETFIILDMFGLLREEEDRSKHFLELIDERRPEAVLTRRHFSYRAKIEFNMRGEYSWITYGTLEIGLRQDIASRLFTEAGLAELQGIYPAVDMEHECCKGDDVDSPVERPM